MTAAGKRWGRNALLAVACVLLYEIELGYEANFFGTHAVASLAHLHTGLLFAIALLVRDRWALILAVSANLAVWMVRGLGMEATPEKFVYGVIALPLTYVFLRLAAGWLGWPRDLAARRVTLDDLPRFAFVGGLALPGMLGAMTLVLDLVVQRASLAEGANSATQVFFAKQFGILVMTLPLLVSVTLSPPRRRSGTWWRDALPWQILLVGVALPLALIFATRVLHGSLAGWEAIILDHRLLIAALLIAACLRLDVRASMPLLCMVQLLLVAAMTGAVERSVGLPDLWAVTRIGIELLMLQTLVVALLLSTREREGSLRNARRLGEALRTLNRELDGKVAARTAELSARTQELHVANADLSRTIEELRHTQGELVEAEKMASLGRLVAGVAHEVNTPLGVGITGMSHLQSELQGLRSRIARGMGEERADLALANAFDACALVQRNLDRVAELVRTFKQVDVDSRESRISDTDLSAFLAESAAVLRTTVKAAGHDIEFHCPPGLHWTNRAEALHEVLFYLVDNALQHAFPDRRHGRITIRVRQDGESIRIEVGDDGVGIPPAIAERVFEPFFTTRRQDGSGLGLHIAYNLVAQSLSGRIALLPAEQGALFELDLPRRHPFAAPVERDVAVADVALPEDGGS